MDEHRPYSRDLALLPLPKRHAYFETWEFDTRAKIMAACGGGEFQAELLFANIDIDQTRPWDYQPRGTPEIMAKRETGYRRINVQLWAALLAVMKQAIKGENDGSATLQWKLFHEDVVKATTRMVDVAVRPDPPWMDGSGNQIIPDAVMVPLMPEFNGQFLWCKMRRHVEQTSKPGTHRAKKEFHQIKIQGGRILEFLANVEDVALEAGYNLEDQYLLVKDRLEHSPEHKQMFQTWKLIYPGSTDLTMLKDYFRTHAAEKYDRFKAVPSYTTPSRWNVGAAVVGWPGTEEDGSDEGEDWSEWYGGYAAATTHEDAEEDEDESPGDPWEYGDEFYDATTETTASWQEWTSSLPVINFATAARFKGRKGKSSGKGKGYRKGFRRIMSKGRAGKKGKGQGKGYRPSYGSKGKGAASTSWEEDEDPTAFYDPNDANPLNHFYWDAEWGMPVYDPEGSTDIAAAALKSRKGKKGGKKGSKSKGGKPDNRSQQQIQSDKRTPCIQWSENRCTHGKKCRYSHDGPGSFATKGAAPQGKGVAAPYPSELSEQWAPAGHQQWTVPAGPNSYAPAGHDGSATLALTQPYAAAQRQALSGVHPDDKSQVERYMHALYAQRAAQGAHVASATLQTSSPPGLSLRDSYPQ